MIFQAVLKNIFEEATVNFLTNFFPHLLNNKIWVFISKMWEIQVWEVVKIGRVSEKKVIKKIDFWIRRTYNWEEHLKNDSKVIN